MLVAELEEKKEWKELEFYDLLSHSRKLNLAELKYTFAQKRHNNP